METIQFRAMGCAMSAALDSADREGRVVLARVPHWFCTWEETLSRFRPNSELNQLNRCPDQPVAVSPVLWEVLCLALDAARWTSGLVVPTLLDALEAAGYDRRFEELVACSSDPFPASGGGARSLPVRDHTVDDLPRVDANARTVTIPAGVRLDLGGIAKGWAADQAAWLLRTYGPSLVDAGGDIAVTGPMASGDPWPIGVADPQSPSRLIDVLRIASGGVATSGKDHRRWFQNGIARHHIIDPRTKCPAESDVLTATVVAPTAVMADVAAKAVLILGSRDGMRWLDAQPPLAGLIVRDDGQVWRHHRLRGYLE